MGVMGSSLDIDRVHKCTQRTSEKAVQDTFAGGLGNSLTGLNSDISDWMIICLRLLCIKGSENEHIVPQFKTASPKMRD